jgi:CubicO group peptidase (beta-lactamase class C family)
MTDIIETLAQAAPTLLTQHGCTGLALAVLAGEQTDYRTFGFANVERAQPIATATRFHVCSISKAVATWGVMRLVDDGRLDLDAPVDDYLTRWHLPPGEFDNREVTARRLLSHTAGLPVEGYMGIAPGVTAPSIEAVLDGGAPPMDARQLVYAHTWGFDPATKHEPVRVKRRPGAAWSYSGGGYLLLDLLLEEITGMTAAAYLDRAVLEPLGLVNSTFADLDPATKDFAVPYDEAGEALPRYRYMHRCAGGMTADIRDLARFVAAEMNGPDAQTLLRPASYRSMFEPVIFAEHAGGMDFDMGLGHFLGRIHGVKFIQHSGGSAGWRSIYFAIPELRRGFAALLNSSAGNEVWQALARAWAGALTD